MVVATATMPESDQPYLPPTSDITLPTEADAAPAIPHDIKVMMVIGIMLCAGWPLFFGAKLISHPAGGPGLFVAVLLMSAATWKGFAAHPRRFRALALGLLILGLLSLIPFLPLMLGGLLLYLVESLPNNGVTAGLTPIAATLMTLAYAASYILAGLGVGSIIQSFRDPDLRRTRGNRRPPATGQ